MQRERRSFASPSLADEAGSYLAYQWMADSEPIRRGLRARARNATWNVTVGALLTSSVAVYICGLVFLARLL